MDIIDEDGLLFGYINIVDAVVLALVLAVTVAGASLIFVPSDDTKPNESTDTGPNTATINATLDLGTPPDYVVQAIDVGDTYSPDGTSKLTVTDVFTTPVDSKTRVLLRVRLRGVVQGDSITYSGSPPKLGRELQIRPQGYDVSGVIEASGGNSSLTTRTVTVLVRDTLGTNEAKRLQAGDSVSLGGRTVATIRNITLHPTDNPDRSLVVMKVDLNTVVLDGVARFGGTPVDQPGRAVSLPFSGVPLGVTLDQVGGNLQTEKRTIVVRQVVSRTNLDEFEPGSEITVGGRTTGTIRNRTVLPADAPGKNIVYLTLDLTTVSTDSGSQFAGRPVRVGERFRVATEALRIDGQIEAVGSTVPLGESLVLLETRLDADVAAQLDTGDKMRLGGKTVATVRNVSIYQTNDSGERVAYLGVSLTTVQQPGTVQFGSVPIQRGESLTLTFDEYSLTGGIERVGGPFTKTRTDVLVTGTMSSERADELDEGDRAVLHGRQTAVIRNVTVYGTDDPDQKRVAVGVSLTTVDYGGRQYYGATVVQPGTQIAITTDEYTLSGSISRVGASQLGGEPETRTVQLQLTEIRSELARAIQENMTEQSGGNVLAKVTNVSREPSTILLRSSDGTLARYDHPTLRDVTLTTELQVRLTETGVQFKGETIQLGSTVVLDLGTITIEAKVVAIGS